LADGHRFSPSSAKVWTNAAGIIGEEKAKCQVFSGLFT
jgi:hypothetical protein